MRLTPYFSLVLLFVFTLSGCVTNELAITPVQTETASPSPTQTNQTATLTSTASPTETPLPSSTPTAVPTLPVDKAEARLLDLLANNGGCRLPCLWGITPGKSTYQEAEVILAPLSGLSDFTGLFPGPGDISPVYTEGDFVLYSRIAFLYPEKSIVSRIAFNAEAHRPVEQGGYEDVYDSKFFGDKVSTYMLPQVLSEQGIPSSVMIATFGGSISRDGTGGFDILLLYPDQGILVNYTTQMHLSGTNVRGCPPNAHVEMELYPPGQGDSFFKLLEQTDWAVKKNWYKPLEEATSMSIDEFYEVFREPTSTCIETPANLWPIPES